MTHQFSPINRILKFSLAISLGLTTAGFAQTPTAQITPVQRQKMVEIHKKMADMHTKMVTCLESDKAPSLCRQEMLDTCSANFSGECPMIGKGKRRGGRGAGMMGNGCYMDWMMNPDSAGSPATSTPKK